MTETTFGSVSRDPEDATEPESPLYLPPDAVVLGWDWHVVTGGVLVIPGVTDAAWIDAVGRLKSGPPMFQRWTKWVLR